METMKTLQEEIAALTSYYRNKGLLIVGLNDSQGVNTTPTPFKKGLLEYLAHTLTSESLTPEVINAFSLLLNKTEHIDYMLENNLTLEEIKLSQIYSAISAIKKVMEDYGLPRFIGNVGNIYRLVYTPKKGDESIRLTSSLKLAKEPTVIYSSGVNNLMREVGNNPVAISKDYKNRNITPNYDYTLEKAKNPETLQKVLDSMKQNLENILTINPKTDIYTLGAYVPKSLRSEEMDIFRNLILEYNIALEDICKKYEITFINTEDIGQLYNNSESNFHISTAGHNYLANHIIDMMYERKIASPREFEFKPTNPFKVTNRGSRGMIYKTAVDHLQTKGSAEMLSGYARERQLKIAEEHQREADVFRKVLKATER